MGVQPCEGRLSPAHNESADAPGLFCVIFPGEAVLSALSDKVCRIHEDSVANKAEEVHLFHILQSPPCKSVFMIPQN